jgi:hypothetical protein
MTEASHRLFMILNEEREHYELLCLLAEEQKKILIAGQVEKLTANVQLQEKEIFKITPLAQERKEILDRIAKQLKKSNFALENCMTDEWEESSSQLKEAIRMLVQQVRRLEVLNRGNEKLLKNALGYVQFTLKVLNATSSKDPVQLKEALPAFSKPSSKFVNQVV